MQVLVGSLVGWLSFVVKRFWALRNNIYDFVCYDLCHCNAILRFWALWYDIYNCVCLILGIFPTGSFLFETCNYKRRQYL